MAREPRTEQAEPTRATTRDENGFELDQWSLPVAGPARAGVLAALGKPDPALDPEGWSAADTKAAAKADTIPATEMTDG